MPAVLAVGAHLKNAVAIAVENQAIISQHIGDLETAEAYGAFENAIASLSGVYGHMPEAVACDLHPDYLSTKYAQKMGIPLISVQHHYAHILSCMAENQIAAPAFGISWDGTGFGLDGTVWGGEFLSITENSFGRFGHLRTFRLPGGDAAVSEPRRAALGLLYEVFGDSLFEMMELPCVSSFSRSKLRAIAKMLQSNLNSPVTSSAGRLFDAVSSIVGLRQITRYEGQAAMELEFALDGITTNDSYPFDFKEVGNIQIVNWEPMIRLIMKEKATRSMGLISAKFHNTLAEIMVEMAKLVGDQQVVLSGGCFQNKYLTERAVKRLTDSGFRPYWHQRIPPNDGGIALGQILAAARMGKKER
jgi:hydrogenase maturation protein HypF